jgi:hypothetical protein
MIDLRTMPGSLRCYFLFAKKKSGGYVQNPPPLREPDRENDGLDVANFRAFFFGGANKQTKA